MSFLSDCLKLVSVNRKRACMNFFWKNVLFRFRFILEAAKLTLAMIGPFLIANLADIFANKWLFFFFCDILCFLYEVVIVLMWLFFDFPYNAFFMFSVFSASFFCNLVFELFWLFKFKISENLSKLHLEK